MDIFFSHSSADARIVQELVQLLQQHNPDLHPFYSSDASTGIAGGKGIMAEINHAMESCQVFVAVITENYTRSAYCFYELSVAAFLRNRQNITIVPIAADYGVYTHVSSLLQSFDLRYIDAGQDDGPNVLQQTFPWITADQLPALAELFFSLSGQQHSARPYIGMPEDTYHDILEYCEEYGIRKIKNTVLSSDYLKANVRDAKEIYLLSTTGASLLKTLSVEAFPAALANGCQIHVLLPNQHSPFCQDVAEIERPNASQENLARLAQEYASTMSYLKDAWDEVTLHSGGRPNGNIYCYCSHTLLRQTILLVIRRDGTAWGWLSLTMPPKRTIDGTPSIETQGSLEAGQFVYLLWNHCHSIIELSRRRGSWFRMDANVPAPFFFERIHAQEYWSKKYQAAKDFMQSRQDPEDPQRSILIEVAAQHPLKNGCVPGTEFRKRLDLAIFLFHQYRQKGCEVSIYVPGSRHRVGRVADQVSLSKAGTDYLIQQGISPAFILGESENSLFKGNAGVYNSADECYVASQIFQRGPYQQLFCVCSPNQVMRKTLFYIEFGIIPQCYSVPTANMFHNPIHELFESIDTVLYHDHDWQDPGSAAYTQSRRERMPENPV